MTIHADKTNAPAKPKNETAGTSKISGPSPVVANKLDPMNKPAAKIPIVMRFTIFESLNSGASEPSTSMFIFN